MFAGSGRCVCVTAAVALAAGAWAATGLAATVPNPCTVVSTATIASTLGFKGTVAGGKFSTQGAGKYKQGVCTFRVGSASVKIEDAPHVASGGSGGGAPGMKVSTVTGFGGETRFYYDTRPGFMFASLGFTKGNIDAGVYENGNIAPDRVLALARLVYNTLP